MPDWLTTALGSIDVGQAIVIVLVGVAALYFIIKKLWPGLKAAVNLSDMLGKLPEFMERTDASIKKQSEQLDGIYHETHNNDGSSIKDSTGRIEKSLEGVHGRLDLLDASDSQQAAVLEDVQTKLTRDHDRINKIVEQTLTPAEIAQLKKIIEKEDTK